MTGRRTTLLIVAAVTAWFAITFVAWAIRPLSDTVPIGVDYSLPGPKPVTSTVQCNTLFESSAREAAPPPSFNLQPGNAPPLGYQRNPCESVHRQGQGLFVANLVVLLLVWIGAGLYLLRARRGGRGSRDAVLATSSAAA